MIEEGIWTAGARLAPEARVRAGRPISWADIIGITAALGFLSALLVHGAAFGGIDVFERYPALWLLHLGMFVVLPPMSVSLRSKDRSFRYRDIFRDHPGWIRWLLYTLQAYAILMFIVFLFLAGTAEVRNGEYALVSHGGLLVRLMEAEYHARQAHVALGFSALWLLTYLVAALYFLVPRRPKRPR